MLIGPWFYHMGSIVITLVSPSVGLSVRPWVFRYLGKVSKVSKIVVLGHFLQDWSLKVSSLLHDGRRGHHLSVVSYFGKILIRDQLGD